MRRRNVLGFGLAAAGLVAGGGLAWRAFAAELAHARTRVATGSQIAVCRFGAIEYAVAGTGAPVMMIHGTGGGFDQGLAFARPLIAAGHRVIAPSRFGYLRSTFPDDPSSANQADAFADLLDALAIERASVIGGSAGALSAIEFAIRHPDRCSALVAVVPATYAPGAPLATPPGRLTLAIIERGLRSDFLFWAGLQVAEKDMIRALLATDPALVERADAAERARAHEILRAILPVSTRTDGLLNDAALTRAPAPAALERIRAPTLAVSLEDDLFGTLAAARHIADAVPGARLLTYPTGGHIWVGRNAALFAEIGAFLARIEA